MATAPANTLPLFYNALEPLSSATHGALMARSAQAAPFLSKVHAIPITVDEFVTCQRFYPVVFSGGENPVPLALMALNEGINVFIDDEGKPIGDIYIPAYVRRYPFMLARLRPDADELSLCFDPTSDIVGTFEDGTPLFEDGKPSEMTTGLLKFCEDFELAAQKTNAFVNELQQAKLMIDGEVSIQANDDTQPFVYRGFQMVSEEKVRELRGDELRKMNQNGMLPLILAHLFSLQLMRELFAKQIAQGKMPEPVPAVANA